jgi:hypothetical protein
VEPVSTYLYGPVVVAAQRVSREAGRIQSGSVNLYLPYLVAVLVIILFAR